MTGTEEPTTDPYVLLVRALRDELGRERGWQARVADLLGVHPTYISKIDRGERPKVGRSVKVRAVARGVPAEALLPRDADRHEAVDFAALAQEMLADPERAGMAKTFKNIEMALPASAEARVWRTVADLLATRIPVQDPEEQADTYREAAELYLSTSAAVAAAEAVLAAETDADACTYGRRLAKIALAFRDADAPKR